VTADPRKYPILYVDDEPENLLALSYALDARFDVMTAKSGQEALEILARLPIAVLLCDQRMPGMTGVELCRRARELRPDTTRMLLTAYSDVNAVIAAINQGQVSRFLLKPWRKEELEQVLESAIEIAHLNSTVRELQARLLETASRRHSIAAAAELVHELANPLAAMTMALSEAAQLADRLADSAAERKMAPVDDLELLRQLHGDFAAGVTQLGALLRRLREDGEHEAVTGQCDLSVVLASAVRMVRRVVEEHARLDIDAPVALTVGIDPSVAAEIMLNLLINASQAIEASGLADRTIRATVAREGSHALLVVEDDGPGIAALDLARVFEGRFSTRGEGRGLGLAITRELVWRCGGEIDVASEPGAGARFVVRLPLDATMAGERRD